MKSTDHIVEHCLAVPPWGTHPFLSPEGTPEIRDSLVIFAGQELAPGTGTTAL